MDRPAGIAGSRWPPLAAPAAAAAAGIVLDRQLPASAPIWWLLAALLLAFWRLAHRASLRWVASALLLAAIACLGAAWDHAHWRLFPADEIGRFARDDPQPAIVRAVALGEPVWAPAPSPSPLRTTPQGDSCQLLVRMTHLRQGRHWRTVSGTGRLTVEGHLLGVRAGDRLQAAVHLVRPSPPMNPGEFDYSAWLRKDRQLCELRSDFPDCVRVIASGPPGLRQWLGRTRGAGNAHLWEYVGERRAGLAATLLLNDRQQLDRRRKDSFFHTGTIHLLAISGMHVGILVGAFFSLARLGAPPRRLTLLGAAAVAVWYALLTDSQPPVLRSAVLVLLVCTGQWLGKRSWSFNALSAAALVVMAINPAELFQVGAQLSFLAVAALSAIARQWPRFDSRSELDRLIDESRSWPLRMAKTAATSLFRVWFTGLLVWLVTLPLILHQFHLASPVALALNTLFIVPVIVAMLAGFGVLLLGSLSPPAAELCGRLCDASLGLIEWTIDRAEPLPGAWFWTCGPPGWWTAVFYLGVAAHWSLPRRGLSSAHRAVLLAIWISIGFGWAAVGKLDWLHKRPGLECTFLSVGHGAAVVLELPDGRTVLYDAGRLGSPTPAARGIAGFLWTRGVTHLDAVVLSHADADHYNALPELMEFVSVGAVYVSPQMFSEENAHSPALEELRRAIEEQGVALKEIWSGDQLSAGEGTTIDVLHPPRKGVLCLDDSARDNANSIVLLVEHGGKRLLLPGDLAPPGLEDVLAEAPTDCDVVLAPHHGSAHSHPARFAAWSTPEWVVISGGDWQEAASARAEFASAGAAVLHTAQAGAVSVRLRAEGIEVRRFRGP